MSRETVPRIYFESTKILFSLIVTPNRDEQNDVSVPRSLPQESFGPLIQA